MVIRTKATLFLLLISLQFSLLFAEDSKKRENITKIPWEDQSESFESTAMEEITGEPLFDVLGNSLKVPEVCGPGYYKDRRGNCRKNIS